MSTNFCYNHATIIILVFCNLLATMDKTVSSITNYAILTFNMVVLV